ncbi:MAG: outer membrane beta-barrel protein [Myxococcota bacterium]
MTAPRFVALGVAALALLSATAQAQPYPPAYPSRPVASPHQPMGRSSFGLRLVGATAGGDVTNDPAVDGGPTLLGLGMQSRWRVSPHWSLELGLDFLTGKTSSGNTILVNENSVDVAYPDTFRQSTVPVGLAVMFHLLQNSVIDPYLLGGLGLQWTSLSYEDSVFQTDLTESYGQLGAGAQVWLGRDVALHADVRSMTMLQTLSVYQSTKSECQDAWVCEGTNRVPDPSEKIRTGLQFQAGLTLYW